MRRIILGLMQHERHLCSIEDNNKAKEHTLATDVWHKNTAQSSAWCLACGPILHSFKVPKHEISAARSKLVASDDLHALATVPNDDFALRT
jgi:hypothetical protein